MGTNLRELLIELDRSKPRRLRAQIEDELRDAVRSGRLPPGAALPSSRALATDLGITRGVVVDAYDQLIAEGYLLARTGAGTIVNPASRRDSLESPTSQRIDRIDVDFYGGEPDLELFPRAAWARATRAAMQTMTARDIAYGNVAGIPTLRAALADYLGRVRRVDTTPDRIVVTSGFNHAFNLVSEVLRSSGRDLFAVEDPGYDLTRNGLELLRIRHLGIAVDDDGIDVDALRRTQARVAVVTPAHQSPTGVVLTAERRHELIDWAGAVDGFVIEDDYDAEYRYDRRPIGSLQGLAPDRVIYIGTMSKTLAPGVRIGWMVVPPTLVDRLNALRRVHDGSTSGILQATFANFLYNGDLDRHLRRSRHVYRTRRDGLIAALSRWLPDAETQGIAAGLHVFVNLPVGTDEIEVVDRAVAAGVRVYPLAQYRVPNGPPLPPALVLGYGSVTPDQSDRGIRVLADVLADLQARR